MIKLSEFVKKYYPSFSVSKNGENFAIVFSSIEIYNRKEYMAYCPYLDAVFLIHIIYKYDFAQNDIEIDETELLLNITTILLRLAQVGGGYASSRKAMELLEQSPFKELKPFCILEAL